jgi:Tol biopolymer transport system component
MDIARGATSRLTFSAGEDESPVWAANGSRVAYGGSVLIGRRLLNWKRADGGGSEETLWEGGTHTHLSSASADGMLLAFTDYDSISSGDIWTLPLTGERKPRLFLKTPFNEYDAKFSPDGRWLAYTSDESGRTEVYVQAFPGPGGKWQVSVNGGHSPVWARNGRELFYRNASHTLAVSVPAGATFSPGTPQTLFSGEFSETPRLEANYDVAPDGRFLVVKGTKTAGLITSYIVVLNLMEELKSRIPVGKK